jgi:putative glycosyltransferase (TIGR04372 family)
LPVFARLQIDNPNALYIYGQSSINKNNLHCSDHISHLDSSLSVGRKLFSPEFCLAYEDVRKILDYRLNIYIDSIDLHYNSDLSKPLLSFPKSLGNLKQHLRLPDKYVVFNVNLKKYNLGDCDRKRIHYPERYNCLIDSLIEKGYTVVIQGRKEQPAFSPRRGLIDYSKTPHISIENDISLYSGCQFAVISKSGPDNFTVACNVPLLGLNYVELPSMQANLKMRYFHKHVRDKKTGRLLSWQEFLKSPCYFDVCAKSYQDMEYVDMEEEEMLEALEEFIPLLSLSPDGWQNYTDLQKKFTASLHPMHLDLYYIKSAPCDCYLRRTMGNPC